MARLLVYRIVVEMRAQKETTQSVLRGRERREEQEAAQTEKSKS